MMKLSVRLLTLSAATLLLSGCATPEARVRTGLMNAGLSAPVSACMAERMVDQLSLVQLRRLQSLASVSKVDYRKITVDQYLHRIRALGDSEILTVTSKAALICTLG
jgi:hypothetical protein